MIWGLDPVYGSFVYRAARFVGLDLVAAVSEDSSQWGTLWNDLAVVSPQQAEASFADVDVIVAMEEDQAFLKIREQKGKAAMYSPISFFLRLLPSKSSVLEIGPGQRPLFTGSCVKYFDVVDAEGLRERSRRFHLPLDRNPEKVDYVSSDGSWDQVRESFDLVFSAHLIEHQTDPIRHFQTALEHVRPGGAYVLVIPDKRYCFDHFNPESTVEDVLAAYYEQRRRHPLTALFRGARCTHNFSNRHWQGDHGMQRKPPMEEYAALTQTWKASLTGDYVDTHGWYYTPESFRSIITELCTMGLLPPMDFYLHETERNDIEFFACMVKK